MLGTRGPWKFSCVKRALSARELTVQLVQENGAKQCFPVRSKISPGYDSTTGRWRHLNTCQYQTILVADIPKVKCKEHSVISGFVPWAVPGSGFTAMFEAFVIDRLKKASTLALSRREYLSWSAIDRVMQCAVEHGSAHREQSFAMRLSVDETAFKKRHGCTTILLYQVAATILHVSGDRKKETLATWHESVQEEQQGAIKGVIRDRSPAVINATLKTTRIRAIKELAMSLWHYVSKRWVHKIREQKLSRAGHSCLELIKNVAMIVKKPQWGILRVVILKVSNGPVEGFNSIIKKNNVPSRGFRNKMQFANAIYFPLGWLNLYPAGVVK